MNVLVKEVPFIDLRVEANFREKVLERWEKALRNSAFIAGEGVKELTSMMLDFTGAKFFIPCANGTDAIQIALRAAGVGEGDIVLVPDLTFWASYEAIINVGAKPVMVDVSEKDYQMDFDLFKNAVREYKPKAAILVHLYGWASSRLNEYREFCKKENIALIEDGAQCMGTKINSEDIFKSAQLATVSFYPAKVLGAAGDAGGIFTNDQNLYEKCTCLLNHGRSSHYGYSMIGWNSRMDELQAHFLVESLKNFPARLDSRRKTEKKYYEFWLKNKNELAFEVKKAPENILSNGYLQVSVLKNTSYQEFSSKLASEFFVKTGNTYPTAISEQTGCLKPIIKITKENNQSFSESFSRKVLNLPLFPYMTEDEFEYVCRAALKVSEGFKS